MSKHGDTLVQHTFWKASVLKSTVIAWDLKLKILCFLRAFLVLQLLKINLPSLEEISLVASKTFRNYGSGKEGDSACSEVKKTSWGRGVQDKILVAFVRAIYDDIWYVMIRVDLDSYSNLVEILFDPEKDIEASWHVLGRTDSLSKLPAMVLETKEENWLGN